MADSFDRMWPHLHTETIGEDANKAGQKRSICLFELENKEQLTEYPRIPRPQTH